MERLPRDGLSGCIRIAVAGEVGLDRPAPVLLVRDGAVSPDASGVAGGAATLDKLRHE